MKIIDAGPWPTEDNECMVVKISDKVDALIIQLTNGEPRVYINRCKHLPIPLDAGTGQFFNPKRTHLVCQTHGAIYRVDTGECTNGPCEGESLEKLAYEVRDGHLWLFLDETELSKFI